MLSQKIFKEFATRFQTNELNILREYLQNLLLSYLYQHPRSDQLAFKGGTALRLLYGSPRFSEDLDFSATLTSYHVETILQETHQWIKKEAIPFTRLEAKTTLGGYFALYQFTLYGQEVPIEWNLSLREPVEAEPILVPTPLIPHYQCMVLPIHRLVQEKIAALFRRKKPRDFFDLYFFLRGRYALKSILPLKKKLIIEIRALEPGAIKRELKLLLPQSHHSLLRDFPSLLEKELERASPDTKGNIV